MRNANEEAKILDELDPLITEIMSISKEHPQYHQFEKGMIEWTAQFEKTLDAWGTLCPLLKEAKWFIRAFASRVHPEEGPGPRIMSIIKLFNYLGLVESLGVASVDLLTLLLISCGKVLHVERLYDLPLIVHASTLRDLQYPNVTLHVKQEFLEANGLKAISKFIDRRLRNDIAHLNFKVDTDGKILINRNNRWINVDLDQKTDEFYEIYLSVMQTLDKKSLPRETGKLLIRLNFCVYTVSGKYGPSSKNSTTISTF